MSSFADEMTEVSLSAPHHVVPVTLAQLEEIAKAKMKDLNAADLDAAVRIIAGSARSMGVTVEGV